MPHRPAFKSQETAVNVDYEQHAESNVPAAALLLMQVWKGTTKASEHALVEAPVAITSFVTDGPAPRVPTLAVAAGPHVYMFRSLLPYYKFTLPAGGISPAEDAVW
jgi:Bardet-Biedl syndrome 1 protein